MDGLESFREMAAAARLEAVPPVDVTDRVLRSLRKREKARASALEKPWLMLSAVSFASAVVVAVIAVQMWFSQHDPLVDMFGTLAMVVK